MNPVPQPDTERPSVAKPLLSNGVLHAGQSDTTTRRNKMPRGELGPPAIMEASCSFDAECFTHRGEAGPGDGFAYLSCRDGHCSCRLEPRFPADTVVDWAFDAVCTSADRAQQLLRDECLKGSTIAE